TADLAFALLLAVARRLPEGARYVRAGQWTTWDPLLLLGRDVYGATLGIAGMGRIGAAVARRAAGTRTPRRRPARGAWRFRSCWPRATSSASTCRSRRRRSISLTRRRC